jgi:hypothetical protein
VGVGATVGAAVGTFVGSGDSHMPLSRQLAVSQSAATRHVFPGPHAGQIPPPQSTSVSEPPRMPSMQSALLGLAVGTVVGALVGALVGAFVGALVGPIDASHRCCSVTQPADTS